MRASSGRFQYVRGGKVENNLVKGGIGEQDSVMFKSQPKTKNSYNTISAGHAASSLDGESTADPITFTPQPKMKGSYLTGGK